MGYYKNLNLDPALSRLHYAGNAFNTHLELVERLTSGAHVVDREKHKKLIVSLDSIWELRKRAHEYERFVKESLQMLADSEPEAHKKGSMATSSRGYVERALHELLDSVARMSEGRLLAFQLVLELVQQLRIAGDSKLDHELYGTVQSLFYSPQESSAIEGAVSFCDRLQGSTLFGKGAEPAFLAALNSGEEIEYTRLRERVEVWLFQLDEELD